MGAELWPPAVTLCPLQDLTLKTQLEAVNGKKMPALEVFAHALRFFKEHALQVRCGPIPCLSNGETLLEVIFSSLLPSYLVEPALAVVLGAGEC